MLSFSDIICSMFYCALVGLAVRVGWNYEKNWHAFCRFWKKLFDFLFRKRKP